MRFSKTKDLKKRSDAYNKKVFRKNVIKTLKLINKRISRISKQGDYMYSLSISESEYQSYIFWVSFRYLRRYSNLNVEVVEDNITITKDGKKYVDLIYCYIKWY